MSPVSHLTAYVVLPTGEVLPVTECAVTLDETWAPFASAQLTVPWTAERAAALDPRAATVPRVTVVIRRDWYDSALVSDLSEAWAGLTLADVSTDLGAATLADLTAALRTQWESGWREPDELTCYLGVRARPIDYAAGTITVRAASDELLAQDSRGLVARAVEPLPSRIVAFLTAASIPVERTDLSAGAIFVAMPAMSTTWTQTMWDAASGAASSMGLRLLCDHTGTWRLLDPDAAPTATLHMPRVSEGTDDVDRDGDWADTLVWIGTGTNSAGETITRTVTWPDPIPTSPRKIAVQEVELGNVGAGIPVPSDAELSNRLSALSAKARALTLTAPADLSARPGMALTTGAPSLPATAGVVSTVTFRIPEDTMTIVTRSTVDA